MTAAAAIGRVVGTERKPNTPHEFHFWTAADSPVGIGTLVKVVDRGSRIVDRGSGIGDHGLLETKFAPDPLSLDPNAGPNNHDPRSPIHDPKPERTIYGIVTDG